MIRRSVCNSVGTNQKGRGGLAQLPGKKQWSRAEKTYPLGFSFETPLPSLLPFPSRSPEIRTLTPTSTQVPGTRSFFACPVLSRTPLSGSCCICYSYRAGRSFSESPANYLDGIALTQREIMQSRELKQS